MPQQFKSPKTGTLYALPDGVSKDDAMDFIAEKENWDTGEKKQARAEEPSFGERAARAIEGSSGSRVRGFLGGAAKGAIEQVQHPFTFGGPQTQQLIEKNVPGGKYVNEALDVASPGSAALGAAGKFGAPIVAKSAPRVLQAATSPGAIGAATGGYLGYKEGGVPGAVIGAASGYRYGPRIQGALGRLAGPLLEEGGAAAGGAAAKAAAKPAAEEAATAATRLVKTPEELTRAKNIAQSVGSNDLSQMIGKLYASGKSKEEVDFIVKLMEQQGKITPEMAIASGLTGGGLLYGGIKAINALKGKGEELQHKLNPLQKYSDLMKESEGK